MRATTAAFRTLSPSNDHDLFFAQGYVEGSDRLFQMDLLRRLMLGELADSLRPGGAAARRTRTRDSGSAIVRRSGSGSMRSRREILGAFSDGVNAAMAREPLPVEFRLLAYRPEPWTPQDSLAVAMATVLDLTDDWNDIEPRDAAYRAGGCSATTRSFRFTDPCYDAPVLLGLAHVAAGSACKRDAARAASLSICSKIRARRSGATSGPPAQLIRATGAPCSPTIRTSACGCRAFGIWSTCARRDFA